MTTPGIWFLGPERVVNLGNWRCTWPAAALRERGHDAHAVCQDGETEADLAPGDVVVVHHSNQGDTFADGFRQLAPFLQVIRRDVAPRLLVVQWDDSYFDLADIQEVDGKGWYRALMEDVAASARVADRIIVTTPYLQERFEPFGDVRVVPNYVARWVTELELPPRLGDRAVWLGSLGGVPEPGKRHSAHLHDWLWAMQSPLTADFPLKVVGVRTHREHRWFSERFDNYTYVRATSDLRRLYTEVGTGTAVGLAPVEPDLGFNKAKSWIKPLEYASLGIRSVSSATPEYNRLAVSLGSVPERTADAAKFWTAADDMLAHEVGEHRDVGLREFVREHLTVEANVSDWIEALDL